MIEQGIIAARHRAMLAGLNPVGLEIGVDVAEKWPACRGAAYFLGLRITARAEDGATVLAVRGGRIGRYEVVIPQRFDVEA